MQGAEKEPERVRALSKGRYISDVTYLMDNVSSSTRAKTKTKRIEAAPLSIKRRVEQDEALPKVQVKKARSSNVEEVKLCAVVGFVLKDLKPSLVKGLKEYLTPAWYKE